MAAVFSNPNIDVIVVRPIQNAEWHEGCGGHSAFHDEQISYGWVALNLYSLYGNEDKTVILTGWGADNQIKGVGCFDRTPS